MTGLAMVVAAAIAAAPAPLATVAHAASPVSYTEGTGGHPFSFDMPLPSGVTTGDQADQTLSLANYVFWTLDGSSPGYADLMPLDPAFPVRPPDPRSVQYVGSGVDAGDLVISDRMNVLVGQVTPGRAFRWWFGLCGGPNLHRLMWSQRLDNGDMLICDRLDYTVFVVDHTTNEIVWQYGTPGQRGLAVDHLMDPFCATRLPGGDTLICDSQGGYRILRVRSSDYRKGDVADGFDDDSLTTVYGTPGVRGTGDGQLYKPHFVQRLGDGTYLITDSGEPEAGEYGSPPVPARILRVDANGQLVTSLETHKIEGGLSDPNQALALESRDTTLITDTKNDRVIEVGGGGSIEWSFGSAGRHVDLDSNLFEPRSATRAPDGRTFIADTLNHRVIVVGYPERKRVDSVELDFGGAGEWRFRELLWNADTRQGETSVSLSYKIDSRPWRPAGSDEEFTFPANAHGTTIRYRVDLTTSYVARTPKLEDVTVVYQRWIDRGPGAGNEKNQNRASDAGDADIPVLDMGETPPAVTGGSEVGSGGGSGGGAGSGTGPGTGGGGTAAQAAGQTPAQTAGVSALPTVAPTVAPPTTAGTVPVTGVRVASEQLAAAGPTGGGGPGARVSDGPLPRNDLIVAIVLLLVFAGLSVPWPIVARQLRRLITFDHTAAAIAADRDDFSQVESDI